MLKRGIRLGILSKFSLRWLFIFSSLCQLYLFLCECQLYILFFLSIRGTQKISQRMGIKSKWTLSQYMMISDILCGTKNRRKKKSADNDFCRKKLSSPDQKFVNCVRRIFVLYSRLEKTLSFNQILENILLVDKHRNSTISISEQWVL